MAYVYSQVDSLVTDPPTANVGTGHCVPLVQQYAQAPLTGMWKEGKTVKGLFGLAKGTAIATFVGGKYPNNASGNHAALFVSQDASGITVVDQYRGSGGIRKRVLRFKGKIGTRFVDPSNNGDAFSVIE
jgi:hypothetical protein